MPQALGLVFFGSTAGISAFGVALTTATGSLTFAGAALSLTASLALSAATAPSLPSAGPVNLTVNTAQEKSPRYGHYGRVIVGGTIAFSAAKNGRLYRVIVHGHGEVSEFERYYLNGVPVTLDVDGLVTDEQYVLNSNKFVLIRSRVGQIPSADYSGLVSVFDDLDDTFRLDGLATTHLRCRLPANSKINAMYPNREPTLTARFKAKEIYDPRADTTAWSANLALVIRDFLTSEDGFGLLEEYIDDSYFITAANLCDEDLALAEGGTYKRYEFHGSYSFNEAKLDVLQRMLSTGSVDVFPTPDGKIGIEVGTWYEPDFTITDDMVLDFDWDVGSDEVDGFNTLLLKFRDPEAQYEIVDAQPWEDLSRIEIEGSSTEDATIHCHTHAQTRSVGKILTDRLNPKSILNVRCKPSALAGYFETRMKVNLSVAGVSGTFIVANKTLDPKTLNCTYELREISEAAYTLSTEEQGEKPDVAYVEGNTGVQTVTGFNATGSGVRISQNTFSAGITAGWDDTDNDALTPRLEFALSTDLEKNWSVVTVDEEAVSTTISGLIDGQGYDLRLAWVSPNGSVGDYAYLYNVTAIASSSVPATPTDLSVDDLGSGRARVYVTATSDDAAYQTLVYRDAVLVKTLNCDPNQELTFVDDSGAGTFSWTARSTNVSNVQSLLTSAISQTIT